MIATKPNVFVRRMAAGLVLLSAPFVAIERADAACAPPTSEATPVSNATVTCTGATTDQNADNVNTFAGYGTGNETAVTVNVESGASVKSSSNKPASSGIFIGGGIVNNHGIVTVAAGNGTGIFANNSVTITNTGFINVDSGTHGDNGVLVNSGTADVTNSANGLISGGIFGIRNKSGAANVTNQGLIQAASPGGIAILGGIAIDGTTVNVTNSGGLIEATGANSTAIRATGDATVINSATDSIVTGTLFGIDAANANVANSGVIAATGANSTAIHATGTVTVTNTGDGTATGVISGRQFGIDASSVTVNSNSGMIGATDASGTAINATTAADITNAGQIRADNSNSIAIASGDTATIHNSGTMSANGLNGTTIFAVGDVNVDNSNSIQATGQGGAAITSFRGKVTVNNLGGSITGGSLGVQAPTLDVTNAVGATISGGTTGINGSGTVTNAGTITGGTRSVSFTGAGTNTLTLQTGSTLIGDAVGSPVGINKLILQGNGTADNNFLTFDNLDVNASGLWTLNGDSTIRAGAVSNGTMINSGTLAVNGTLSSTAVTVKAGGTLAGQGTVAGGLVSVMSGGAVAPGAAVPFSTLNVGGNVNFGGGSIFRVNADAAVKNDKLAVTGTGGLGFAILTGGTVNVLASGTFAPSTSTKYTILTAAAGGLGGTNIFSNVTTTSAFLTPTLTYDSNDVFLTLATITGGTGGTGGGFGFASAAQTRNQKAVAGALDASPTSSPLVTALLNQTADGARQAFDALSGEVLGSVQTTQAGQTQFARSAMLGRLRQASYAGAPGELGALGFGGPEMAQLAQLAYASGDAYGAMPVKHAPGAQDAARGLTFWAQGLGGWGHTDSDGNAASVRSRFGGFLSGVDARYGDTLRAGLVAGYLRSDLNSVARSSSAGIDSVQLGAYAGGRLGVFNVRGGASYSYDSIDTSRAIAFPGFSDQTHAHLHGNVGQVFGEAGYGMTFNQLAVEPLAGLAYVHLHNGSFLESGGVAALSGSSANENIGYSSLGLRAATLVPLGNGTVLVPRGSLQWQYAFGDVSPVAALAFQGTGTAFSVAGVPIARNTALVEGGFDWRFSPQAKLGAFYQGELAAHAQAHAFKGGFTWDF